MGHSILSLHNDRFDSRICFGGCMININGETIDCEVTRLPSSQSSSSFTNPTYEVRTKQLGTNPEKVCTFRPYHLTDGPRFYRIESASKCGGDATLIVPEHGMTEHLYQDLELEE